VDVIEGTWQAAQALIGTPEAPEFTDIQSAVDLNDSPYLSALPNDGVVYTFSPLLVSVKEVEKSFRVFPNPVYDILYVELNGHGKQQWQLTNGQGMMVMSGQTQNNTERLDVSNLSTGVYFLQIFDNISSHVEKVVIK
jgi:hypothetical protein